jgi:flagellin-like protein
MRLRELLARDEAVSPVIGVILMVAITVILAAVIGAFVLGIGQGQQTAPATTFDYDYDSGSNSLEIVHTGGDSLTSDNSAAIQVSACSSGGDWLSATSPIVAGSTFNASDSGSPSPGCSATLSSGDTVRIVWIAPGRGKTQTIGSYDVPN